MKPTNTTSKERIYETDRMFHLACELFKQWYADWPKRVGLAYSTRYRERLYDHTFYRIEPIQALAPVNWYTLTNPSYADTAIQAKRIEIHIDPAYIADDEVLCEWENTTVKMSFVFTEHGYHCICQEVEVKENRII